jgi:hypothetical protein
MALDIKPMSVDDLRLTLSWAAAEGWNPGVDDAEAFFAADPGGFLMGWVDGEPIVSISAVAYGDAFGFIGLYICKPEWRGHAHGMMLARAALERLADRTAGLDGVVARIDNYARLGFAFAHQNLRFGGAVTVEDPGDPRVKPIGRQLTPEVIAADAGYFKAPRRSFLEAWLAPGDSRSGLALVEDGAVTGYGVIRDCQEGAKIGPLFAPSAADAEILFRALASRRPTGPVFLDVPEPNRDGVALAERYGLTVQFETARMYRGGTPDLPLSQTFGITTFELG